MVLELLLIGGVVFYYVRKNKDNKARKAAFIKGEPFVNRDGTTTYPPNYPGLPAYTPRAVNTEQPPMGDFKRQQPHPMSRSVPIETPQQEYRDEKAPLYTETREVMREKM